MKKKMLLLIVFFLILIGRNKIDIKENKFKNGIDKFVKSEFNDENYKIKIKHNEMIIKTDKEDYKLTYKLGDNSEIIYQVDVKKGINYDVFNKKLDGISLPMIGYIALANNYGVSIEDAYTYFSMIYINGIFSSVNEDNEIYIITDDTDGYENTENIILTSEFGEKAIEFVKNTYKTPTKIEDNYNKTFNYELSSDCKEEKCTITSKLVINKQANFKKIKGYADKIAKDNMDDSITPSTADYNIELVVGQKITITGIEGYEMSGMSIVEADFDNEENVFTAIKPGIANGKFNISETETKSFYITVIEKDSNSELKDQILKIIK